MVHEGELKNLHQHGDKALDFLETHEAITYTKEEEKAVLRKIDKVLIPLTLGSYTIQYMDKSVMAQTTIYDLFTSLGLHGQQYSWCSAIFYFGYLAFQSILARLLNYVPLGRFVTHTSPAEALTDVKVWYGFFYAIACVVPATSVANFGSLIINGFGFGTFETSLLNCPLGVVQDMTLIAVGYIAYTYKDNRCLMQILCNIPAVIGSVLVYALPQKNRVGRLLGFYMTPTTNGSLPMLFALTTTNIAGHTKTSVATSVLFLGYCAGFIIGPQFFLTSQAPRYQTGFQEMIVLFALSSSMPAFYWLFAKHLNRQKARKLQEMQGADQHIENEEFFDLTDKQQQHFVYSM
ncbi:hypothetical protein PV11_08356 [Exophiala sideris]|uniref:Major facilitator superfamily (MFS) profile domain-containing protein n=1 Tax=Exophiala sideris TaxID=1016849 RepID=A0A0D1YIP7_9EURO|nr:hypothetical protein PV11_08356 [Exophiala sideris]